MVLVDDAITGFDRNKPARRCLVVKVEPAPRGGIWVLPRSTQGSTGTFVPAGAMSGLSKDGRFQFLPRFVAAADLEGCENLGPLPEPHRSKVLESANMVVVDVAVDL